MGATAGSLIVALMLSKVLSLSKDKMWIPWGLNCKYSLPNPRKEQFKQVSTGGEEEGQLSNSQD